MEDLKAYLESTPHGQQALAEGCWFDLAAAEKFRTFAKQFLKITVGPMTGQPFVLLDWQYREVVAPILGWRKPDGNRLIRSAFISCGKKVGKSSLAAALLLYFILTEGNRAEIYSAACTRDQAAIIFREAAAMLKVSKPLQKYISSRPSTKTLVAPGSNSFYRALSADAGSSDGISASVVYIDEIHQWDMAAMFEPDLRAYLLRNADVQAAVGNRLFYNSAPQNERRARIIARVSSQQTRTVDKGPVNDWTSDLSIDTLAPSYREAATTASALAAALGRIRNVVEGETILSYVRVFPAEDIPSMPVEGSAKPVFGKSLRAVAHWREVRPSEELPIDPAARYRNMIFAPDQCTLL